MLKTEKIKLPMLPNFLFSEENNIQYSVADFTDKELTQLGKEWTDALIAHAHKKQKNKSNGK